MNWKEVETLNHLFKDKDLLGFEEEIQDLNWL